MFGPRFADMNKIKGENIIFIKESDARAVNFFKQFARPYNLRNWDLSFREHDEMMAYSLSLPFAATIAFSACIKGQEVPGTTFSRHMEIAHRLLLEDDNLLMEILFNPHSLQRLETICTNMEFLKHVIRARDREEFGKLLARLRRNIQPHIS
jgi:prephenate dehydrogenase